MEDNILGGVLLPGACAVALAMFFTWAWTFDYDALSAEALNAMKEEHDKDDTGILWRMSGGFMN